ncbi:MAG: VCBS repeat-containing protein [Alphaproteobacteria bacterium]|nr:VCBS repeat-containing protein [Alphaproteobacteria bacterium]
MRLALFAPLALAGCIENVFNKGDDGVPEIRDTWTGQSEETGDPDDTAVSTTDDTAGSCDTTARPDEAIATLEDCATGAAVDWNLSVVRSGVITPFSGPSTLGVGRLTDVTGDGVIDARDPGQLVYTDGEGVTVVAADLASVETRLTGQYNSASCLAELDSSTPGLEIVTSSYVRRSSMDDLRVLGANGVAQAWAVADGRTAAPWLMDFDGDGAADVLLRGAVHSLQDGHLIATVGASNPAQVYVNRAADLDLDGLPEIMTIEDVGATVALYDATGALVNTCWQGATLGDGPGNMAIGDLDGDPEGEFVATLDGRVVLCDSDGSWMAEAEVNIRQPGVVGLAQLDDDDGREIVMGDQHALFVLDDDLSLLWQYPDPFGPETWHPFSLADLDADGRHEILALTADGLFVFGQDGSVLAHVTGLQPASWKSQPILNDLDGDGLAEILITGLTANWAFEVHVLENADGGWALPDASAPWPGPDHFPGDREIDGTVPAPFPWWQVPENNVFQGLPVGPTSSAALDISVEEVCVEDCSSWALVRLRLSNEGAASAYGVPLRVENTLGALLEERTVDLAPGVATFVDLILPVEDMRLGFVATLDGDDRVVECDSERNEARWEDGVCG